jgi:hypothetical protein
MTIEIQEIGIVSDYPVKFQQQLCTCFARELKSCSGELDFEDSASFAVLHEEVYDECNKYPELHAFMLDDDDGLPQFFTILIPLLKKQMHTTLKTKDKTIDYLENIMEHRREDYLHRVKIQNKVFQQTFLNGCASGNLKSPLPLIGAKYAYGPVRKQIGEYVGIHSAF